MQSSFQDLGLRAELTEAVAAKGYDSPTPIQAQSIPPILEGRDLLGGSQTGTGKTAAFTLPLLQRLAESEAATIKVTDPVPRQNRRRSRGRNGFRPRGAPSAVDRTRLRRLPRALVLAPTRELAAQVGESIRTYGTGLDLESTVIFGGVGMNPQIDRLRQGVDILVATPGRLLDHCGQGNIDLSHVECLVLDEADRMLDMGFLPDLRRILALLPGERQNLLFSATYSEEIKQLAEGILRDPVSVEVARRNTTAERVEQVIHPVARGEKRELLSQLIREGEWEQVLVFSRTKHGADRLAKQLSKDGIAADAIHGNKSQGARTRALDNFRAGRLRVLVATDVASRGIDIQRLPHVVNYDLPNVPEDYVHRIGRTGRAGEEGIAVSLVCADECDYLFEIERLIKRELPVEPIDGFSMEGGLREIRREANKGRGTNRRGGRRPGGGGRNQERGREDGNRNDRGSRRGGGGRRSGSRSRGRRGAPSAAR